MDPKGSKDELFCTSARLTGDQHTKINLLLYTNNNQLGSSN